MADLDNDKVNDVEIGIVGSGSMGAVSPLFMPLHVEPDVLGDDIALL